MTTPELQKLANKFIVENVDLKAQNEKLMDENGDLKAQIEKLTKENERLAKSKKSLEKSQKFKTDECTKYESMWQNEKTVTIKYMKLALMATQTAHHLEKTVDMLQDQIKDLKLQSQSPSRFQDVTDSNLE